MISNETKDVLVENEFKKYRNLTQVFSLGKITLVMIDHNIS